MGGMHNDPCCVSEQWYEREREDSRCQQFLEPSPRLRNAKTTRVQRREYPPLTWT